MLNTPRAIEFGELNNPLEIIWNDYNLHWLDVPPKVLANFYLGFQALHSHDQPCSRNTHIFT